MKLVYYLLFIGIFLAIFSACGNNVDPKYSISDVYILALDTAMKKDTALNDKMEFIAIDMSNFEHVQIHHKEEIILYFEDKYQVEVMDTTYAQLIEDGLYDEESLRFDGVLLRLDKIEIKKRKLHIEGSKYKSGTGAIGIDILLHFKDGKWEIKESRDTWVS
ncbi:hypothetical protein [Bacillus alkalicellulosilyticus]|uniref:hypothetical protein n=1 Tax=Alkalihalobacterium alkalicellulosilyticum TaxID=1912214 RepID=UPI00099701B8|nr:hypothetical protein [Bacillus alkalicellulosilyticus]